MTPLLLAGLTSFFKAASFFLALAEGFALKIVVEIDGIRFWVFLGLVGGLGSHGATF